MLNDAPTKEWFKWRSFRFTWGLMLACLALFCAGCSQQPDRDISVEDDASGFIREPAANEKGEPFRIAVMDQAPPIESSYLWLKGLAEELQAIGYIRKDVDLSKAPKDFDGYYRYLKEQELGKRLELDEDYYLVGTDDDDAVARKLKQEVKQGKLDLIAATGTVPGKLLKKWDLGIPFLVSMATDPIASGIIDSAENSGNDNIWALVEQEPCSRKFEAYHSMLGFKKLGLVEVEEYEIMGGNGQYRDKAKELGVELEEIVFKEAETEKKDYGDALIGRLKALDLSELDGILFAYGTIHSEQAEEVAALLTQEGIPFLVGDGDEIVEKGGLICLSFFDYEGYGHYAAKVMNDIFHGEKASEQPCIYTSPSRIVVNLDTAEKTGFRMDLAFLRSASVIYRKHQ